MPPRKAKQVVKNPTNPQNTSEVTQTKTAQETISGTMALQEKEIQTEINSIIFEIIDNGFEASAIT